MTKKTKNNTKTKFSYLLLVPIVALFAYIGTRLLSNSSAAPATPLTLDASLPTPQNVQAYGDDQSMNVTWDKVNDDGVIGYYVTYRVAGSSDEYTVRQTIYDIIQLQPLVNGVEYEVRVQSAAGGIEFSPSGPLVHGDSNGNHWPVADGRVSQHGTTTGTPSSTRVDAMRQRLTGFFDDFNDPAGPFDESKWNQATTACTEPGTAAAFLNSQFHTHNQVRSSCDRAGFATRPRAVFDISGATEQNPAQIEFDIDGASHPRDTWYLDLIPLSARANGFPLDITAHNDAGDTDNQDPGNMLRINQKRKTIDVNYYNTLRNTNFERFDGNNQLTIDTSSSSCSPDGKGVRLRSCDMSQKTPGLSPLLQTEATITSQSVFENDGVIVPNVRRHWVLQLSQTKMKIFVDSVFMGEVDLPQDLVDEQRFTVHSTIFSYNTGKGSDNVIVPYTQLFHWDNFGFTGPAPTETIHNYIEGGANADTPVFSTSNGGDFEIPDGPRTTVIPVPDQIGSLVNDQGRLFFTIQNFSSSNYKWAPGDHLTFNGTRYDVPDPRSIVNFPKPNDDSCDQMAGAIHPFALAMPINSSDIQQGNNTVRFEIQGQTGGCAFRSPGVLNVHLELPYAANDQNIPSYTQPLEIFGQVMKDITQPSITNCDSFLYIEQDLGLPYQSGKTNLDKGECVIIEGHNSGPVDPGPLVGDVNDDGVVNIFDLSILLSNWNMTTSNGDVNGDGTVSIFDLSLLLGQWSSGS